MRWNIRWMARVGLMLLSGVTSAQSSDDFEGENLPKLNTATLKPGSADIPSSVTVITKSELRTLGITQIYDALRLVPGMAIAKHSTTKIAVGYHGTNTVIPRRMEVLIDGMSLNLSSVSTVYWNAIPISIEDIERIEVTRSPEMPLNGANSFQATINFITRHPGDTGKHELVVAADSNGLDKQSLLVSGKLNNTDMAVRFENIENPGFDAAWRMTDAGIIDIPALDGQHDKKLNLFTNTRINEQFDLMVQGGLMESQAERLSSDVRAISLNDEGFDSSYINTRLVYDDLNNDVWSFQGYAKTFDFNRSWDTCYPTFMFTDELRAMQLANPKYAAALAGGKMPSGGSANDNALALAVVTKVASMGASALAPQCGNINEDFAEKNNALSAENRHIFGDKVLLISGLKYESKHYHGETQLGGSAKVEVTSLYSSIQYNPTLRWTLNAGALYSKDTLNHSSNVSPMLGAGYHFYDNHVIKFGYSESFRSPTILEKKLNWSYHMRDFSNPFDGKTSGDFYRITTNPFADDLVEEKLATYDISLNGSLWAETLEYDLRVFDERFTHLISQDVNFTISELTNNSETHLKGAEAELHHRITTDWKFSVGLSYIRNNSTHQNEKLLFQPYSGFSKLTYLSNSYSGSLAYYSANNDYTSFDMVEATFGRSYAFTRSNLYWQAKVSTQQSDYLATLGGLNATGSSRGNAIAWHGYDNDYNFTLKLGASF